MTFPGLRRTERLGVGRIRGPYEYDENLYFPHKRPVEWLTLEPWHLPEQEGLQNVVWELGKSASNLKLQGMSLARLLPYA